LLWTYRSDGPSVFCRDSQTFALRSFSLESEIMDLLRTSISLNAPLMIVVAANPTAGVAQTFPAK
jgi:hypothetical protein